VLRRVALRCWTRIQIIGCKGALITKSMLEAWENSGH
jgi:hypothetical protein